MEINLLFQTLYITNVYDKCVTVASVSLDALIDSLLGCVLKCIMQIANHLCMYTRKNGRVRGEIKHFCWLRPIFCRFPVILRLWVCILYTINVTAEIFQHLSVWKGEEQGQSKLLL